MIGEYRPATAIEPGWHIRITNDHGDLEWREVTMVMETETDTGQRRLRFVCAGNTVTVAVKSDQVMSRTPTEVRQADA